MSWQEELRALDEKLAAGQISADEYRVSRDQLLSIAASAGSAAVPPESSMEKTQFVPPITAPPADPQPPKHDADKTQIVSGQSVERTQAINQGSERTQAVAPWQAVRPQGDGESTQVVQGLPPHVQGGPHGPRQPPMGYPQQPPAPWSGGPQYDEAPPWAGSDFPPLVATGNPDWVRQGPEVFETGSSKRGKVALAVVAALVVLGLAGGAVWFFGFRDDGGNATQPTTSTQQAPTTTSRPKDDLEIAPLPGDGGEKAEITSMADVLGTEVLAEGEKKAYTDAGGDKARLVSSKLPDGSEALVLTVETGSPDAAATAREALVALQKEYTMKDYTGASPAGVKVTEFAKSEAYPAVIRGHYTHKSTVVRVQVSGDDLAKISKVFDELLATQLETLAADA